MYISTAYDRLVISNCFSLVQLSYMMSKIIKHKVIVISIGNKTYRYTEIIEEVSSSISEVVDLTNEPEESTSPLSPTVASNWSSSSCSPQYVPSSPTPPCSPRYILSSPHHVPYSPPYEPNGGSSFNE